MTPNDIEKLLEIDEPELNLEVLSELYREGTVYEIRNKKVIITTFYNSNDDSEGKDSTIT